MPDLPPLTVGDIRKVIADLPDDACVFPNWVSGPPSDADPGVSLEGVEVRNRPEGPYLSILVDLFWLDQEFDEDEDEDEDE